MYDPTLPEAAAKLRLAAKLRQLCGGAGAPDAAGSGGGDAGSGGGGGAASDGSAAGGGGGKAGGKARAPPAHHDRVTGAKAPDAPAAAAAETEWACLVCTLRNAAHARRCAACETERGRATYAETIVIE